MDRWCRRRRLLVNNSRLLAVLVRTIMSIGSASRLAMVRMDGSRAERQYAWNILRSISTVWIIRGCFALKDIKTYPRNRLESASEDQVGRHIRPCWGCSALRAEAAGPAESSPLIHVGHPPGVRHAVL